MNATSRVAVPQTDARTIQRFGEFTRVYVVEQDPTVRKALVRVLASDSSIQTVGDARDPDSAAIALALPDVVLIDVDPFLTRPGAGIEDALLACHSAAPHGKVCALSLHLDPKMARRAMTADADAYIVKDTSPTSLIAILHAANRGECYVDPRIAGALLRGHRRAPRQRADLSTREGEIVRLIAEGLSNREIGLRLVLSEKTVKNHISRIFVKLNVSARSHAAVFAIRNGLA
ncbi:MAG: LuxR C-terminal-related transcriptional regulator [Vulcanimicrobiaceae bacterium]